LAQDDFVFRPDASELDEHTREPFGVTHGVLQLRSFDATEVGTDDEREALDLRTS
jgi:hypothetical protein